MHAITPELLIRILTPKERIIRVIDVFEGKDVYGYEITKNRRIIISPERFAYANIISGLQAGTMEVMLDDPYLVVWNDEEDEEPPRARTEKQRREIAEKRKNIAEGKKKKQERRHKIVRWLIEHGSVHLYDRTARAALIAAAVEMFGSDRVSILRWLGMYWRGGMVPAALHPDYSRGGRPIDSPSMKKPGINKEAGAKTDQQMRDSIKYYFVHYGNGEIAYEDHRKEFLELYANAGFDIPDENGESKIRLLPKGKTITLSTFLYYRYRDSDEIQRLRDKIGLKEFGRDFRGIEGSAITPIYGPGSRFEADFTVASNLLVSSYRRSQIIGSPVVGVVWDVYSGAAVGLIVTFENASAMQLRLLVANTLSDKVAFCKRYGKIITPEQWPMRHSPKLWVLDRGEGRGVVGDFLTKDFNWTWRNLQSMRPDLKPVVESGFAKIKRKTRFLPGWQPRMLKRGEKDRAVGACMTIDEFTAHIIDILLEHNSNVIKTRAKSLPTLQMDKPATPNNMWTHGSLARGGHMRYEKDQEKIWRTVLPSAEARVTFAGIEFDGVIYTHSELANAKVKRRLKGRKASVKIHYDPDRLGDIYMPLDARKKKWLVCRCTGQAEPFKECSFTEYDLVVKKARSIDLEDSHEVLEKSINTRRQMKARVKGSKKATIAARKEEGLRPNQYHGTKRKEHRRADVDKRRREGKNRPFSGSPPSPANVVAGNFVLEKKPGSQSDSIVDSEAKEFLDNFNAA